MKKTIYLTIVSLGLFLLGCEKNFDDEVNKQNPILDYTSKRVTIETIPEIRSFIEKNMKSPVYKFNPKGKISSDSPKMIFDKTSAIEVIEKDNTKKYTFTFRYDNTPESVFYNLVINDLPNGEKNSYVMKFTCDESHFVEYKNHSYNFNYFQGKMDVFKTSTFFNTSISTNKSATTDPNCPDPVDQYGDPIPQASTPISGGSGGGSTSGGGIPTGTGTGSGTGGGCTVTTYTISCWCRGELVGVHNHIEPVVYYYVSCSSNKTSNITTDCPKLSIPNGVIGAIDSDPLLFVKYLKPVLPLTNNQYVWLRNRPSVAATLYSYLLGNDENALAKSFELEIIDKMILKPAVFTTIAPFLIEKIIDDTNLDPCSKAVFQRIKNTTNCDFANLFAKLGAKNSVYNTTIKTEHNNDGNGNQIVDPANTARTTPSSKYNYTVYVNPDYNGKTKLYIATLLLHETAHAYFFSLVDDFNMGATNSFNELPILFNATVVNHFPIGPDLHHEEIANSYVYAIASALQEYQPGLPQQVYEDLAWAGLMKTSIFNQIHPEGSQSRQRIKNRIACEQVGYPIAEGGITQNNLGQPCN